jgi:Kef-type K+ transport system membrane component KefB
MLFAGVAFSITAFPVLCRILTGLKRLDTTVGIVVFPAGVGNDIVGWTLLVLSVALVNAGSGLTALWILLTCVDWTLFCLLPVKRVVLWVAIRTGSITNGSSKGFMTFFVLLMFGSAFLTVGCHRRPRDLWFVSVSLPGFSITETSIGAFIVGLIVPRRGNLAITLTEKLKDAVLIILYTFPSCCMILSSSLVRQYLTISGLSTDLGLLNSNSGVTWRYTIAICATAYLGKFGGCSIAVRFAESDWRESTTIGSLMSCKG